jgi:hypothetical protein
MTTNTTININNKQYNVDKEVKEYVNILLQQSLDKNITIKDGLEREKQLSEALSYARDSWTHNEPSESVMQRYFAELLDT